MGNSPRPQAADGEALDVYEFSDGRWAWCYRDTRSGFELHSNHAFATRQEAVVSARRAYPDVAFVSPPEQPD